MSRHLIDNLLLTLACIRVEVFGCISLVGLVRTFLGFLGESRGFQFYDALNLIGGQSFALGLEALDGDKLFGVDVLGATELVGAAVGHSDEWIDHIGEQHHLRLRVLAQEVLLALETLHEETLEVGVALVVSVEEYACPHLVRLELFYAQDIFLVVVVGIEVGEVIVAVLENHQNLVVVEELAQESSVLVVVQSVDIRVEPHLAAAQRRVSLTLQSDAVYGELREDISL